MTHSPSEPFAGIGVADRERKEAEREAEHQDVHHGVLLVAAWFCFHDHRCVTARLLGAYQDPTRSLLPSIALRCHPADRFSRRSRAQSYMNPIKIRSGRNI